MTIFNRTFDVKRAKTVLDEPENAWFRDLLKYWRPAGEAQGIRDPPTAPEPPAEHLRLAIRNESLNFYRGAQSVAEVTFANGKLEAQVHNKYIYGAEGSGQDCVKVVDGGFAARDGSRVRYREN